MMPKRARKLNRLNEQDCVDATCWRQGGACQRYRMVVCIDPAEDDDIGDFLMVYRRTEPWASWGVARRGARVLLWRCADGADIGTFETVGEALGAIENAA